MADKEFIDRKALVEKLKILIPLSPYPPSEAVGGILESIVIVNNQPVVDVEEVKHGYWKVNECGGYVCSECDCWLEDYYGATPEMMNYCFKCGAKMDGERK